MAEVIKTAWIGDPKLLDILETQHDCIYKKKKDFLEDVVFRCVKVKAQIVMADEKEGNLRRVLNFGHTFGHAIEQVSKFAIPHGNAVAVGMRCALLLGQIIGITENKYVERLERLTELFNLPSTIPGNLDSDDIITAFYSDKKKQGDKLTFVVSSKPGKMSFHSTQELDLVKEVIERAKK